MEKLLRSYRDGLVIHYLVIFVCVNNLGGGGGGGGGSGGEGGGDGLDMTGNLQSLEVEFFSENNLFSDLCY